MKRPVIPDHQISALQRLTGLIDYPSRKAIHTSFIAFNFNYCPLVWFFISRESIDRIDKIQERVLRFVLKGEPLYICFVDFSKAFDLVNRHILFFKIMKGGWSGRVIDTLKDLYSKT